MDFLFLKGKAPRLLERQESYGYTSWALCFLWDVETSSRSVCAHVRWNTHTHTRSPSSCLLFQPRERLPPPYSFLRCLQGELHMCSWISTVSFHVAFVFSFSYSSAPAYILWVLLCDLSINIFSLPRWHLCCIILHLESTIPHPLGTSCLHWLPQLTLGTAATSMG